MPTVIDSLVVKLGLDASGVKKGRAETDADLRAVANSAHRTAADLQSSGKGAAEFFGSMHREALGLIGTLVGATGLEQIVRRSTESMASLGREAANLNVDPQKLAAFSMALERFGASGESTRQTLFGISQAVERFKLLGDPSILKYLQVIGAGPQNSSFEILQRFIAYAQAHKKDAAQVNLIGQGLGIDQGTINAALQLKSLGEFWKAYQDALKLAPTKEQIKQSLALYEAWKGLEQAAKGVANAVTTDMFPALESFADWAKKEIEQHPKIAKDLAELVASITVLSGLRIVASTMGLTGLASAFGGILVTVEGIVSGLAAIGIWYEALHVGGLNAGEQQWLDNWRKEHGLPYGDQRRAMEERKTAQYLRDHPNARLPEGSGPVTFPIPAAQAGANRDAAEKYFRAQGYTPQQVAGIVANMQAESSFNPRAENKGHYGYFQWDKARQLLFAQMFHHTMQNGTPQEQLEFAQWELTHTEKKAGDALRKQTTRRGSGSAFSHDFERPGSDKADEFRGILAQQYTVHPAAVQNHVSTSHTTHETHVTGPITIHTKATDAHGIARGFADALTVQANRGLN